MGYAAIHPLMLQIAAAATAAGEAPTARFYLGAHHPHWLSLAGVPLFVSARRLRGRKSLPKAACAWALDSGGFTELSLHGEWTVAPADYAAEAGRWARAVGGPMAFAAVQDWMCEPQVLARTALTVAEHQRRTTESYRGLLSLAPGVPWLPVLQGWERADYLSHLEQYRSAGFDLAAAPLVGLGSVCRRQDTGMAESLIRELTEGHGLRLHGFGFKLRGLARAARLLASADSMAWSFAARQEAPLPGHAHKNCANCLAYALRWREKALRACAHDGRCPRQGMLF